MDHQTQVEGTHEKPCDGLNMHCLCGCGGDRDSCQQPV